MVVYLLMELRGHITIRMISIQAPTALKLERSPLLVLSSWITLIKGKPYQVIIQGELAISIRR